MEYNPTEIPAQSSREQGRFKGLLGRLGINGNRGHEVMRVGGGIRVAVIPVNPDNPAETYRQLADLERRRNECRMPFDDPDYEF